MNYDKKSLQILVVDDSSTMRKIVITALKACGLRNFVEADDGDTALERLEKGGIDMVICDHMMPRLRGTELLTKLRGTEEHKNLPFIMVTAEATRENIMQAVTSGVSNYVVKPFSTEIMDKKINQVLERAAQSGWQPPSTLPPKAVSV